MPVQSAGLLIYRKRSNALEVLLAHNGGPFFAKKDNGFWTVPKGKIEDGEDPFDTAKREFKEETGIEPPEGSYNDLGKVRQVNNKEVRIWAIEADIDLSGFSSNTFELEWPPRSGKKQKFPEIDKIVWFPIDQAAIKINAGQGEVLRKLTKKLGYEPPKIPKQVPLL